jgi:hypothetical protein
MFKGNLVLHLICNGRNNNSSSVQYDKNQIETLRKQLADYILENKTKHLFIFELIFNEIRNSNYKDHKLFEKLTNLLDDYKNIDVIIKEYSKLVEINDYGFLPAEFELLANFFRTTLIVYESNNKRKHSIHNSVDEIYFIQKINGSFVRVFTNNQLKQSKSYIQLKLNNEMLYLPFEQEKVNENFKKLNKELETFDQFFTQNKSNLFFNKLKSLLVSEKISSPAFQNINKRIECISIKFCVSLTSKNLNNEQVQNVKNGFSIFFKKKFRKKLCFKNFETIKLCFSFEDNYIEATVPNVELTDILNSQNSFGKILEEYLIINDLVYEKRENTKEELHLCESNQSGIFSKFFAQKEEFTQLELKFKESINRIQDYIKNIENFFNYFSDLNCFSENDKYLKLLINDFHDINIFDKRSLLFFIEISFENLSQAIKEDFNDSNIKFFYTKLLILFRNLLVIKKKLFLKKARDANLNIASVMFKLNELNVFGCKETLFSEISTNGFNNEDCIKLQEAANKSALPWNNKRSSFNILTGINYSNKINQPYLPIEKLKEYESFYQNRLEFILTSIRKNEVKGVFNGFLAGNAKPNGFGEWKYENKETQSSVIYKGEWQNGLWNGKGDFFEIFQRKDLEITVKISNGLFSKGKLIADDGYSNGHLIINKTMADKKNIAIHFYGQMKSVDDKSKPLGNYSLIHNVFSSKHKGLD